jgi:hypothetical protein
LGVLHQNPEFRKFFAVAAAAVRFSSKTGHSLRDVSLKTDTLLLAVVSDVHSGRSLFFDNVPHPSIHGLGELIFINGPSFFAADEQVGKLVAARQTADMSNKDSVAAENHDPACSLQIPRAF